MTKYGYYMGHICGKYLNTFKAASTVDGSDEIEKQYKTMEQVRINGTLELALLINLDQVVHFDHLSNGRSDFNCKN